MNQGTAKKITGMMLIILAGCSSQTKKNATVENASFGDGGFYLESAFNDHNKPPEQQSPPPLLGDSDKMNPFYLRSQADYQYSLAEAYSLEGQTTKAIESFQLVLLYDPKAAGVRLRLAKEFLKQGQLNKSIEQVKIVISETPDNRDARILLAGLYTSSRNYPQAVEEYEYVLSKFPDYMEANIYLAAVYSETQEYDKSIRLFEKVLKDEEYPNKYLIHYYIGRIREEQAAPKSYNLIVDSYKKANELKPDFADSVLALGAFYKLNKQPDKAFELYRNFQKNRGPSLKIAEVLSQMYIEQSKFDEAYEQLEIIESQSEDSLSVKVRMALILIEKKLFDPAIFKLEEILRVAPDSDKIRFYLAAVYEEVKKDNLAIGHYLKIYSTSSFYSEAMVHAGYLMKNQGDLTRAVSTLETAYNLRKDSPQVYAMYASLLDESKQYEKALDVLKSGIEKFPDNPQMYFYYGSVNDRVGKKELVIENMKKVIELDPNHAQGLNYLAFTWVELGKNLDEAESLAKRAAQLDPEDGYILDTLGWVLYKKGSKKEAVKYLEAAHKFQPKVAVIAEHLGDVYRDMSFTDKAKSMYKKAYDLEIDKDKMKVLQEKILAVDKQAIPERVPASEK